MDLPDIPSMYLATGLIGGLGVCAVLEAQRRGQLSNAGVSFVLLVAAVGLPLWVVPWWWSAMTY